MRRAAGRISGLIMATVMCGSVTAHAVAVAYAAEDFTFNVGLLLRAGHYYTFAEPYKQEVMDSSEFDVAEAELATYGRVFDRVSYDVKVRSFSTVREAWVAADLPAGFSARIGRQFVPFGVEATTPEGSLTCSSRTASSSWIALGRSDGLRFDYVREGDDWPYEIGGAAGVYDHYYHRSGPLVDGAWRVYGTPAPGVRTLTAGCSFYYGKEPRGIEFEPYIEGYYYFSAPRLGFDVGYEAGPFGVSAEYMQYLIRMVSSPVGSERPYEDKSHRGYFATLSYQRPLPYKHVDAVKPYVRYEHFQPAVLRKGYVASDLYTGGFSTYFFDRILMFRADYTRIFEDDNRFTNDSIASEFQLIF